MSYASVWIPRHDQSHILYLVHPHILYCRGYQSYTMVQSRVTVVVTTRTTESLWPHYDNTLRLFTYIANMTKFRNKAGLTGSPQVEHYIDNQMCLLLPATLEQEEAYPALSPTILTMMAPVGRIWHVESSCVLLSLYSLGTMLSWREAGSAHFYKTRFVSHEFWLINIAQLYRLMCYDLGIEGVRTQLKSFFIFFCWFQLLL